MPSILRRSRRREFLLTPSFTNAIQDKVSPMQRFRPEISCSSILIDRTQLHGPSPSPSTPKSPDFSKPSSRPSLTFSLYRSPISNLQHHPIHTLPPEILILIFQLGSFDDALFLITVSHVCHPWRMLAIHTHTLWRRLSFDTHGLRLWKERIARARGCSLDVTIAPLQHCLPDLDAIALHMHSLVPHIARMRSFELRFSRYLPFLWNTALGPVCHQHQRDDGVNRHTFAPLVHALRLEELTLCHPDNDDTKEFALFAGVAPRLKKVTLDGIRLTWLPELYGRLTYLNYTHHGFTAGRTAADEVLGMIQVSCATLRELRICFRRREQGGEVPYLPHVDVPAGEIRLLQLERLVLGIDKSEIDICPELTSLISRLSMPNLRELHLVDLGFQRANRRHRKPLRFSGLRAALSLFQVAIPSTTKVLTMAGRWADPSSIPVFAKHFRELDSLEVDGVEQDLEIVIFGSTESTPYYSVFR
ncbi:hypothetical protein AZE42_00246 [Rhizopogon vesiculosus]|uniref:F-box domain-containing protein n=1 Tax=Rhizopogon vesiculosus TaxID=180088 RepID=A0A1J8Q681_9AGAM|nr:hypothetical protein AZE42_00246 [Rhizopogon vesiculosus]